MSQLPPTNLPVTETGEPFIAFITIRLTSLLSRHSASSSLWNRRKIVQRSPAVIYTLICASRSPFCTTGKNYYRIFSGEQSSNSPSGHSIKNTVLFVDPIVPYHNLSYPSHDSLSHVSAALNQNSLLINLILLALRQITKLITKYTTALSVILIKDPELKCSGIMPLAV